MARTKKGEGKAAPARGRPTTYAEDVAAAICDRIADGEPLRQICRDENMPAWRTVYDWRAAHPEFAARIASARELGFDAIAEECVEIADCAGGAVSEPTDEREPQAHGGSLKRSRPEDTAESVQRAKLRIETRLKLLAKWDPKRYGDKVAVGGDPDAPPIKTSGELKISFV